MDQEHSPWMCHICDFSSPLGEGPVCSECYKIACHQHIAVVSIKNPQSGLYELKQVCAECQFRKTL